ncbi:AT-rich interactive domain-containing protein 1 isoform X2 [Diospyros lotus]|uniref:AT-rich interactive domain-containing protein 1 isoform X2 n=1 Tax=Diospyros lotus TaxID=55363 RepID=UPI0022539F2E|nr:AT-rich interactive domain-containing protein 1 isoform X2 [Diospyros lotus]XP_052193246.1 AT-rich interactive domain-containing protein 1 isoform X2 [Diospyros lotus]XP_052193247.1 AT-rich interactive domain-containing protein 1 isoform X2 [Diospyros lotus]XP_052193248.1 AT-rich interactive domain-containing protein 1 isoform X2 [Diospyros lotus]
MAGCGKTADRSALDCFKTLLKLETDEFWCDFEVCLKGSVDGAEEDKARCLFDLFLRVSLKEACGCELFRPLPPMLGNGRSVDLFKLFLVVRKNGGYEAVSKNGLWDCVAKDSGYDPGLGSAVKLVYVKYLDTLERWLKSILKDKDSKEVLKNSGAYSSGCLMDIETEFKSVSTNITDQSKDDGEYPCLDVEKSNLSYKDVGKLNCKNEVWSSGESDDGRKSVEAKKRHQNEGDATSGSTVLEEDISCRKRKRDCHQRMLDWIVEIAKNPCDPEVGSLPERSKWKCYGSEQQWKQVLLAREAMTIKRDGIISADVSRSDWLRNQRMHPSVYDDHTGSGRVRCSQRIFLAKESQALSSKTGACSELSSGTQSDIEDHFDRESETFSAGTIFGFLGNKQNKKRVPVGPLFQANVPEWSEEIYESDPRWLGLQVWPPKSKEHNRYVIERARIGRGRQDSCGCRHPGSVECVRFHISNKRMQVKIELGSAFHCWKFDMMGEEVALSWKKEDEQRFKEIVRSNPPSMDKCFWDELVRSFPSKAREDLVSYLFNVFILQRRAHQNRSPPCNIDSDEESEFGSLINGFKHDGVKSSGSIFCSPKKPHLNFR